MPNISPEIINATKKIIVSIAPYLIETGEEYLSKDHGSKVKEGAFKECSIKLIGDKAGIVVNENRGDVVFLTSDYIQSYQYVMDKERTVGLKRHTYYYYNITFKDGSKSYVRMRRKYRDAMISHM